MIRVNNRKIVKKLSQKSLQADRTRNQVAVFAIALTTLMFMALFTIAGTMVHTFQQETFRQVGSSAHGALKDLTLEQKELLEKDPMIKQCGGRWMLGMGSGEKFRKAHVELSYMEPEYRKRGFCEPTQGNVPREGTKEVACDTRILACVGVEPKIGAQVTLTYEIGGVEKTEITDTFVLSGWWEYDSAGMASMALLPKSYVEQITKQYPGKEDDVTNLTGRWDLEIVLDSSMHIEEDFEKILENNGYQSKDPSAENYISVGVNWAYAGAQLAANSDPEMMLGVAVMLILIIFTGYLIIYNIFQISVSSDIRFYGLLKTIGTTGKQIRYMIRRQALLLCVFGIPVGLIAGSIAGTVLAPVILYAQSGIKRSDRIMSPWFFILAAFFSLATVLISCAKPGRIAAKVSPVEAVRYTDAITSRKKQKKGREGGKPSRMAKANLGRNKKKTVLVILSMTLAIVLLQITYTFTNGFDMDKYLSKWVVSDFILGNAAYFQNNYSYSPEFPSVSEEDIGNLAKGGQITDGGRIYGHRSDIGVYSSEEAFRNLQSLWLQDEEIDEWVESMEQDDAGNVSSAANVYGMEDYPLSQLVVTDGDLADVRDPGKHAIAAVYLTDDYDQPMEATQFAKVGDTVKLHYVYEWEYTDSVTGEKLTKEEAENYDMEKLAVTQKKVADIEYEVAACVTIKTAMSYRYYGSFAYVMNAEQFQKDSHTSNIMTYLFNTTQESNAQMEHYLEDYTEKENPDLDFESKQSYVDNFMEFRNMFLLMGGALSFIVGIVGILNFFNAILTSIHSRKREFAMLQSIGMTGSQLKKMLIYEGMAYGAAAILAALVISLCMAPLADDVIGNIFWFCSYHFTILPIAAVIPLFLLFGAALPLLSYRKVAKQTIVERLREIE